MMTSIRIPLEEKDLRALASLARQEYRDTRYQAAVIIRDELTRRGLLPAETQTNPNPAPMLAPGPMLRA